MSGLFQIKNKETSKSSTIKVAVIFADLKHKTNKQTYPLLDQFTMLILTNS